MEPGKRVDAIRHAAKEIERQTSVLLHARKDSPGYQAVEEIQQRCYDIELFCNQWAKVNQVDPTKPHNKYAERIMRHIKNAGAEGLSRQGVCQKAQNIPIALREAALQQLIDDGRIEATEIHTTRRPKTVYRTTTPPGVAE
jgi:hypothetical protein